LASGFGQNAAIASIATRFCIAHRRVNASRDSGAQEAQGLVIFLENFFDELPRNVPVK
jgi:hypothetical protein